MSEQVKELQRKLNVDADGFIGKQTLTAFSDKYKLTSFQVAHFFGHCHHESGGFSVFSENLNYSSDGLKRTFSKYFQTNATAFIYARKPEKIANRVYANRMGNGDEQSGEGWLYRGRGAIQLTGKNNYLEFAKFVKDLEVIENPDIVATKYAFESALFYFNKTNIWKKCTSIDRKCIESTTKTINGGLNGLEDRIKQITKFYNLIK